MDGYCYSVTNKKGKAVDFWLMDKPTPKEANFIFSCRFSRYVKPKSKPIEMMFNDALNQELKSQMPESETKKALEKPLGDCISRSSLKEVVSKVVAEEIKEDKRWALGLKYAIKLIDNAPLVFDCRSCKNNGNERECVDCHDYSNYVHYDNRPKGEWIKHIDNLFPEESTEECPFCHEEQFIRLGNDDNYCPNCGAELTNV